MDDFRYLALDTFDRFSRHRGLRSTEPRRTVLETFLSLEHHVSADDLLREVRRRHPSIGAATVYRTLRLLCDSGIAQEVRVAGRRLYEHKAGHAHHDHLVCDSCGRIVEASDPAIESLQDRLAARHGFVPSSHSLVIHGTCAACAKTRTRRTP